MAFMVESMECLNEDKKGHILYIGGMAVLITTSTKLLDTMYMCCEFNDDLIETIN